MGYSIVLQRPCLELDFFWDISFSNFDLYEILDWKGDQNDHTTRTEVDTVRFVDGK